MNQEEITQIYETLAPMAGDYANAQAEQIGQAQRSMGTLAGRTQGATTSGLGNYTYNRLMRPQVQTMRDEIRVQGYANQLNRLLSDALNNARKNYNKSSNKQTEQKSNENQPTQIKQSNLTVLPNSYSLEQDDGTWKTFYRMPNATVEDWIKIVDGARQQQEKKGKGFKYGQ